MCLTAFRGASWCNEGVSVDVILHHLLGLSRATKRSLQLGADFFVLLAAYCLAVVLRFESFATLGSAVTWVAFLPVLALSLLVLWQLGLYRAVVRHNEGHVLTILAVGAAVSAGFLAVSQAIVAGFVSGTLPVIYAVLVLLGLSGVRAAFCLLVSSRQHNQKVRVIVYGAGDAGRKLVQRLREGAQYRPVAFVDDRAAAQGTSVSGLNVHAPDQIDRLARSTGATAVLLALPLASAAERAKILTRLEKTDLTLMMVPATEDILAGRARLRVLPEQPMDAVLPRASLLPQPAVASASVAGKVVLVTSASGTIGRALCEEILSCQPEHLIVVDQSASDLAEVEQALILQRKDDNPCEISAVPLVLHAGDQLAAVMTRFGVQVVFHIPEPRLTGSARDFAADVTRAVVFGTRAAMQAAADKQVERFVLVSTDRAARPGNISAASYRLAEMLCQASAGENRTAPHVSILRISNLVHDSASILHILRRQIEAGGAMTLPHGQMARSFAMPSDVARLILSAMDIGQSGEVRLLEAGVAVNMLDLATRFARLNGLRAVPQTEGEDRPLRVGEVAVRFTGLRPGEALRDSRAVVGLAGQLVQPRHVSVEQAMTMLADHAALFDRLALACADNDIPALEQVLMAAHTGYAADLSEANPWMKRAEPAPRTKAEDSRPRAVVGG
jgi:FlaA1/EpsC-like NDP-sugar epimerase